MVDLLMTPIFDLIFYVSYIRLLCRFIGAAVKPMSALLASQDGLSAVTFPSYKCQSSFPYFAVLL